MSDTAVLTRDQLGRLLEVAHDAVDLALDVLHDRPPPEVTWKHPGDPVSDADLAVERAVRDHLAHLTPDIGLLGEEEGASGPEAGSETDGAVPPRQWVLDPIDGTVNYLHGLPLHAVSLGLLDGSEPVLGVVALPALGHRYSAHRGGGAHRDGHRIEVSPVAGLDRAVVSLGDAGVAEGAGLALASALAGRVQRLRLLGSAAVDLVWVADGTLDATVMLSNASWDVTAGIAIAREAGAAVTDAHGRPHGPDAGSVLAAPVAVAGALSSIARGVAPA